MVAIIGTALHWSDILVLLLYFLLILGFGIWSSCKNRGSVVQVNNLLDQLLVKQTRQFSDFTFLCYWQYQFNSLISTTIFLAWIKIFKFISFNKTMTQLNETLTKCAKDILSFAFAQLGYLTFGIQIEDFRAFQYFVFGQQYAFSRAYLIIPSRQDLIVFREKFQGYVLADKNGNEYTCIVEYAPNLSHPKSEQQSRKDPKLNSIEQDPEHQTFLANINAPLSASEALPNAETILEEIEKKQHDLQGR
ncbi:unnamed protein product [Adineta steineri]|uniref:Uncharacterized protein n=1 Tax=Adineta steineri TaxID=433720 RepID=A0A815Q6X0_9BILA|nr:unnamed protein product [Adineta steineri]CAF3547241.1 unnamed protein product [Adineta steineri]